MIWQLEQTYTAYYRVQVPDRSVNLRHDQALSIKRMNQLSERV